MAHRQATSWRSAVLVGVASIGIGFSLARCGADNANAPVDPPETTHCKNAEEAMPEFFKLVHDPSQPLEGIREVVIGLANGNASAFQGNPLAAVLSNTIHGLGHFAKDPHETASGCAPEPPAFPLCTVTPSVTRCESRICTLKRALDFGLRDSAGSKAFNDLQPLLAKVVGYITNSGDGAVGQPHYEIVDVFNRTSRDEARCSPQNLLDVMDGIVVYFRSSQSCGSSCAGLEALQTLDDLLNDSAMKAFLANYEQSQENGKGRASFQALAQLMGNAFANMPEDDHYFDGIQKLVDTLVMFFDTDPATYGPLKQKVLALVPIAKDLLNPKRPGSFSKQLKAVVGCVTVVDKDQQIVGALYDLLSQPGGANGKGLDLQKDLVDPLNDLAKLDQDGVLMGAIHAVLASIRADDQSMSDLRLFLVDFLTVDNAKKLLPPVQLMIQKHVITEALTYLDTLVYGCQTEQTQ